MLIMTCIYLVERDNSETIPLVPTVSQVKNTVRQVVKANGVDNSDSPTKQLDNCVAGIRGLRSTHTRREVKRDDFKVRDLKREITKTEMKNVNFVAKKVNKERKMSKMNLKDVKMLQIMVVLLSY